MIKVKIFGFYYLFETYQIKNHRNYKKNVFNFHEVKFLTLRYVIMVT